jgi:hypothetical protein
MTKLQAAIKRAMKRLEKRHAHLAGHQGYETLGLLLLELGPAAITRAAIVARKEKQQ